MSPDHRTPQPPGFHRPALPALVAIGVALLAVAGVGTTLAMRGASFHGQAAMPTPSTGQGPSAGSSAQASGSGTALPTTVQPPGGVPTSVPTSTPAAPPAGTATGHVVITEFSRGPVTVARGTVVEVDLSASNPHWNQPRGGDPGILRDMGGSTASDGSATATFMAISDGTTTIAAAQAPMSCSPKCGVPQRAWDVTVTVTG